VRTKTTKAMASSATTRYQQTSRHHKVKRRHLVVKLETMGFWTYHTFFSRSKLSAPTRALGRRSSRELHHLRTHWYLLGSYYFSKTVLLSQDESPAPPWSTAPANHNSLCFRTALSAFIFMYDCESSAEPAYPGSATT
jgi:serine/threonine protein phosphatase PrpC